MKTEQEIRELRKSHIALREKARNEYNSLCQIDMLSKEGTQLLEKFANHEGAIQVLNFILENDSNC